MPLQSYYAKVMPLLLPNDFQMVNTRRLEEACYVVVSEMILLHLNECGSIDHDRHIPSSS
jgi:hypothetical protein